ncbi:MAG: biosynthetic-type acetolactate synthase large subunit, partial [Deltaproteobacteria bacterium]|nr:biosynthetic-type acetolactate synthase large subunit [Deltaproteobacteria bacterium]
VDIVGVSRPVTKHNYLVLSTEELAQTVKEAFYVATSGRPGAVLVDLPKDVMSGKAQFSYPKKVELKAYQPHLVPHHKQVQKVVSHLAMAKKPIIYAGGGVISSGASEELFKLATLLEIPVTTTLMGLGGFPGTHPLSLGMLGMHGLYRANMAVQSADLILAVGARFDDRVTGALDHFAPNAFIIHIDVDTTSIHKTVDVDVPLVADARQALVAILGLLGPLPSYDKEGREKWLETIKKWDSESPLAYDKNPGEEIKPQMVIESIYKATKGKAIIVTEVGQHQMWAAQYYLCDSPRQFVTSGGLGVMGFGLPAALGVLVDRPGATVIDIAGDGSILMNIQELATAVQESLPVKVAILNNGCLGMVRQWQELFYQGRYAATLLETSPDYVKLAEAFGSKGFRATKRSEVAQVIQSGLAEPGPAIMEFVVAREELVYPMVPGGRALNDMLLEKTHLP